MVLTALSWVEGLCLTQSLTSTSFSDLFRELDICWLNFIPRFKYELNILDRLGREVRFYF